MSYIPKHQLRADAAGDDPSVRLSAVTKSYQTGDVAVLALRGVNLTVPQGQFVVILGPSGSGKTTLMNVIGGIETPSAGEVVVSGSDLTGSDESSLTDYRRREVGFVFQFFNLIPTLTAFENVALVAELVGLGEAEARAALTEVGLAERADHFPSALSGGEQQRQQQRVALARALANEPPLLLCDEPTGNLDTANTAVVYDLFRTINKELGTTFLIVTHDRKVAQQTDRILEVL
ncbi:MAG TPA: ABC transporter, partial [Propionibacteriaceae bacterium]|nr:ABC transporter [Propionibacteriaceae bacterium]